MVPVSAAIITDCRRNTAGMGYQVSNGFVLMLGTCNGLVQVVNICLVVLAMVYLHRKRIYKWLQSIMCVGERW